MPYLHSGHLALKERSTYFLVGLLSDLWVAYLAAGLIALLTAGAKRPIMGHVPLLVIFTALTMVHQSYVVFFGHQIIPFHLSYVWDRSFLAANASTAISMEGLGIAIAAIISLAVSVWIFSKKLSRVARWSLVALVAHNRNIHYRVQWFVPDQLQVQGWERLYLNIKTYRSPGKLSPEELAALGIPANGANQTSKQTYESIVLMSPPKISDLSETGQALVSEFRSLKDSHPIAIIYLMESQRPSEMGRFDATLPSLTSVFDQLAATGIEFTQMYSVSNVTRGAQEAVFCGYRAAMTTSMMKGRTDVKRPCLTDKLKNKVKLAFLHGGDGRFDNQQAFWRNHGIDTILTDTDFPNEHRTGWGVGDVTFAHKAVLRVADLMRLGDPKPALVMALSVTNHIPWTIPSDAPDLRDQHANSGEGHPSYLTTQYADRALGVFVESLKREGLWDRTLLLVVSDHGNLVPPRANLYETKNNREAHLQTHVAFAVSGGITETSLSNLNSTGRTPDTQITTLESQVDIASFLALLFEITDLPTMGDGLFTSPKLPVYSDLGQDLFDVTADAVIKPDALQSVQTPASLHFRAFLSLLDEWTRPE